MTTRTATAFLAIGLWLVSCASPPPTPPPRAGGAPGSHGYALLYELLGQEKDVDKLLVVKRERDDFEAVIDAIAEVSARAYEDLGELGEADPGLNLTDTGLPAGERAAREAIESAKTKTLLTENGEEFEIQLSLAQSQALGYMTGLSEALASAEADPARLAFTRTLWRDARQLQERLLAFQRTRHRQPPAP
jgi:hypothetical protein